MTAVTARAEKRVKETNYSWEGKDKSGKVFKGEMRAAGTVVVKLQCAAKVFG